ncbi:MAG TPA: hypothetical protein VGC49_13145 [Solirubrobacterales bacterium]|jgi:hypothetical protein
MLRRLAIPMLLCAAGLAAAAVADGELSQSGNVRISFDGGFSPNSLPRDRPVPVTVRIEGSIATTDGSHPPPLKRLEIELNRAGRLQSRGLPICATPILQSTSTETALRRCRPALVGRGSFRADLSFEPSGVPAKGTILAFNARHQGKSALLLHLYGTVPVRATLVLPLTISHPKNGQFGTLLAADVPKLAGGFGSITKIELKIGREYGYRGIRRGYVSASCAAPSGFTGASFAFARGDFAFAGGQTLRTTLTRDCRVR